MTLQEALERLARAEASLAHLEKQYDELNAVVVGQGKLLARLQKRLEQVGEAIDAAEMERIRATNTKPPHYSA